MHKMREKNKQQSPSSYTDYAEEASTDDNVGKDFGTLVNAPLSKGGHFVLKSEKDWSSLDYSSEYSQFFTLNLNTLSAAIDCIPFNEYIDVEDKYFTKDQLTSICNTAEEKRTAYKHVLDTQNASSLSNVASSKNEMNEDTRIDQSKKLGSTVDVESSLDNTIDSIEDDIDFLLSLKEPVQDNVIKITQPFSMSCISTSHNNDSKLENVPTKPMDLEKWLDSVLDD